MTIVYKLRENDIVDNETELAQSVINNLAIFFQSLPTKFVYEVKIVSSITLADGTRQTGSSQKVQTGTSASGAPKYKTIVNKFAVMDIYAVFEGQTRKKLGRVVLAPVNILNYNKTSADLIAFSNNIPNLIRQNTISITNPVTAPTTAPAGTGTGSTPAGQTPPVTTPAPTAPSSGTTPPATTPPVTIPTPAGNVVPVPVTIYLPKSGIMRSRGDFGSQIFRFNPDGTSQYIDVMEIGRKIIIGNSQPDQYGNYSALAGANAGVQASVGLDYLRTTYGINYNSLPEFLMPDIPIQQQNWTKYTGDLAQFFFNPPTVSFDTKVINDFRAGALATSLFEWYAANNKTLPSVSERAIAYENFGLGPRGTYVGTAEQNIALLAKLKA